MSEKFEDISEIIDSISRTAERSERISNPVKHAFERANDDLSGIEGRKKLQVLGWLEVVASEPVLEQDRPKARITAKDLGQRVLDKLLGLPRHESVQHYRHTAWKIKPVDGIEILHDLKRQNIALEMFQGVGPYFMVKQPVLSAELSPTNFAYHLSNQFTATYYGGNPPLASHETWYAPLNLPAGIIADEQAPLEDRLKTFSTIIELAAARGFALSTDIKSIEYDGLRRAILRQAGYEALINEQ